MKTNIILQTDFPNLKLIKRGKVRDIYDVGEHYLIVSTDRLSAFDVIMSQGIPYKGQVLTKISEFWFKYSKKIIDNHLISTDMKDFPSECSEYTEPRRGEGRCTAPRPRHPRRTTAESRTGASPHLPGRTGSGPAAS